MMPWVVSPIRHDRVRARAVAFCHQSDPGGICCGSHELSETGTNMIRRIAALLTLAAAGLLMLPAIASAETSYPAPSVTTTTGTVPAGGTVTGTGLASTGAGFSIGAAVLIGALILAVGLGLVLIGNRFRKSNRAH